MPSDDLNSVLPCKLISRQFNILSLEVMTSEVMVSASSGAKPGKPFYMVFSCPQTALIYLL